MGEKAAATACSNRFDWFTADMIANKSPDLLASLFLSQLYARTIGAEKNNDFRQKNDFRRARRPHHRRAKLC